MKYYYKEKEITKKEDWKNAFCSAYNKKEKEDKHWREGRSAECLAEDFMGENATGKETMIEMVSLCLNTHNISLEKACIEHASKFDEYKRPRMQDLAIWGRSDKKNIFIGIEAKVDEKFGSKSLSEQRKYVNNLKKTDAGDRLDKLIKDFLDGKEKENESLRYQLLYYLAGSIREPNTNVIFLPVIVYKTRALKFKLYSEKLGDKNYNDYVNFMKALGFKTLDEKHKIYHKEITDNGITKDVYSTYIVK
jgi:hypothetical protein